MNAAQTNLYFFEWSRVRRHYLAKGIDPKQADAKRHELHVKALGVRKSSKDFTNADLDKVIASFRAVSDDANLDAQLRQLDQPERRRDAQLEKIAELARHCGIDGGEAGIERYFAHWFRGRTIAALAEQELNQLAGLLERRASQLTDEDPF